MPLATLMPLADIIAIDTPLTFSYSIDTPAAITPLLRHY
jgi:hypothetical protein